MSRHLHLDPVAWDPEPRWTSPSGRRHTVPVVRVIAAIPLLGTFALHTPGWMAFVIAAVCSFVIVLLTHRQRHTHTHVR